MRVLALDLARLTGWAIGSTEHGVESFGTHEFPRVEASALGEYGMAARMTFRRMLAQVAPDLVVFEAPILRSGTIAQRGNGKSFVKTIDTPQKLRKIYGLPWELEVECYKARIEVEEANMGSVRAHFLMGKIPRASKECKIAVKVMARRRGWNITDDNEADALAVLDWQLTILDPSRSTGQKISVGGSARLSSSGPGVFVRSPESFPRATRKVEPENSGNGLAGPAVASSTGQKSPGATMAIIRPSAAAMSSTSSGLPARQKSLALEASGPRRWKR